VFVTGYYQAACTLYNTGGGTGATLPLTAGTDCFIAKYSSAGAVLWAAQIAGSGTDQGTGIATDASGNVFVAGFYSAALTLYNANGTTGATLPFTGGFDGFVAKYSSAGAVLWAAQIAGTTTSDDRSVEIASDPSGNVVVTGYYGAAVTLYNTGGGTGATLPFTGGSDVFVAKYSSAGAVLWAAQIASTGTDYANAIATDSSGSVFVTGEYGAALTLFNTGGTTGATLAFTGGVDAFVAKYSSAGAVLWATRISAQIFTAGNDIGFGLATDTSGSVFVTGSYNATVTLFNTGGGVGATLAFAGGNYDCFVAKYSSAGAVLWATRIASTGADAGDALATDSSGNVFVGGTYQSTVTLFNTGGATGATLTNAGNIDSFIAKYSSAGAVLWVAQIASTGGEYVQGIATDTSGNVFATGTYAAALTFYNTGGTIGPTLPFTGGNDCFIAKYSSDGLVSTTTGVANSLNVAGGYYVNGVQLVSGSAIATYSNSGAVLLADGTSTGLRGNSNLFFSNNSNLGIQTITPSTALDVNGGVTIRNGYRPLYSNVSTGSSLSISANTYGTHYSITTSALTAITLPTITWASDSNAYWVFRNNTGTYLSITFTYTSAGTTAPTNPVTIPPANSVTMLMSYPGGTTSNYVLF
jgi:hypothetical protein